LLQKISFCESKQQNGLYLCFLIMMKNKKLLFYLGFFAVLVALFWWLLHKYTDTFNQSRLPQRSIVQPFEFVNQDGMPFNNQDMLGKVCVVEYFFTTCPVVCPRMNNNMKKVYEAFKDNSDFLIASHTCMPETDSAPVLKRYADSLKINTRRWTFITGRKDSLYKMARFSYGIDDPNNIVANLKDDFIHSQFFALVDKNGNVRGAVYDGLKQEEIDKLIIDIKDLLKEKRKTFVNGSFTN
jgi:protein SCO1